MIAVLKRAPVIVCHVLTCFEGELTFGFLAVDKPTPTACMYTIEISYLDGNAIAVGLAYSPGPDWLKDIVSTLGVRLKVHITLRTLYNANMYIVHVHLLRSHPRQFFTLK